MFSNRVQVPLTFANWSYFWSWSHLQAYFSLNWPQWIPRNKREFGGVSYSYSYRYMYLVSMYIGWCPVFLQKMSMNSSSVTHVHMFARRRWCLLSSPYIHLGKKNNYTHFVHIWTNSRNKTCFKTPVPLHRHYTN